MKTRYGIIALLLLTTSTTFGGELFIANGTSSSPTSLGDQAQLQQRVMAKAIESAARKIPSQNFQQVSSWNTSYFYAGSRIYGVATASFKNPQDQAPWFVTTSGKYVQIYKSNIRGDEIREALVEAKEDAQMRAHIYCGNGAFAPDSWQEGVVEDSYKIIFTVQARARFECR